MTATFKPLEADLEIRFRTGVYGGLPLIGGVPVNVIRNRFLAGETLRSIEDDFDLTALQVEVAIRFCLGNDPDQLGDVPK